MSRKQKGLRGKKITVQLLRDEDRDFRALADGMNQSVANAARLVIVAEIKRRKEESEISKPIAVNV